MNYLKLYEKWCKEGYIENSSESLGEGGLCNTVIGCNNDSLLELFKPSLKEMKNIPSFAYWGAENNSTFEIMYEFNDFRKNVVLFIAAMEGQL